MVTAGIIREGAPKKTAILLDFVQILSPPPSTFNLIVKGLKMHFSCPLRAFTIPLSDHFVTIEQH